MTKLAEKQEAFQIHNEAQAPVIEHDGQREVAPYTPPPGELTPMLMLDRAVASGASVETLEKLMGLQERWEANQARKAFDNAIAAAKAEIPVILKSREVDFTSTKGRTHYRYEDLAGIVRTVDPILAKHGLSCRFRTATDAGAVTVTCILSHRDGHSQENTLSASRDESGNKNSIQAVGSTITYLQRYTLKAALGLAAAADDDGAAADSGEKVSAEQRDQLIALADEFSVDKAAFCKWAEVPSLADIRACDFNKAKAAMQAKGKAQAKANA